jgi:hypothetical protein
MKHTKLYVAHDSYSCCLLGVVVCFRSAMFCLILKYFTLQHSHFTECIYAHLAAFNFYNTGLKLLQQHQAVTRPSVTRQQLLVSVTPHLCCVTVLACR